MSKHGRCDSRNWTDTELSQSQEPTLPPSHNTSLAPLRKNEKATEIIYIYIQWIECVLDQFRRFIFPACYPRILVILLPLTFPCPFPVFLSSFVFLSFVILCSFFSFLLFSTFLSSASFSFCSVFSLLKIWILHKCPVSDPRTSILQR